MKVSIVTTVKNEESSIGSLLDSLINQAKKASEIIVVDGGSSDKTIEIIKHYQKKHPTIKLLRENCTRSVGRNLGIEIAKSEIIAITDAGCIAKSDWVEKITDPFVNKEVDIVAGFYDMVVTSGLGRAMSVFLGVTPRKFDNSFFPSARSMAFTKRAWEIIGGFPEKYRYAEDTHFNYFAKKAGLRFVRVKDARVEWRIPETISGFKNKIFEYALGDAQAGYWLFPEKGLMSHNIKALTVFARYTLGILLLVFSISSTPLFFLFILLVLLYFVWSFRKVYFETREVSSSLYGPFVQVISDFYVMYGFLSGILGK